MVEIEVGDVVLRVIQTQERDSCVSAPGPRAAVQNAQRAASNVLLLTSLGGGAFGNDESWIHAAMRRALKMALGFDLDVKLVSYGTPSRAILQMAEEVG